MRPRSYKGGFTIFELSMVLTIIGLIVGGIMVGRSLIRQAELRSIMSDSDKIQSAIFSFEKKYEYWPGDFPRATSYWGTDSGGCPGASSSTPQVATCNGDGNGKLNVPTNGQSSCGVVPTGYEQEPYRLWQHLANANMFPGLYTGTHGSGGVLHGVPGLNIPKSTKIDGVGFQLMNFGAVSNAFGDWTTSIRLSNVLFIGKKDTSGSCLEPITPFLLAEEAYVIDTKLDDGAPGTGNLMAYSYNSAVCATTNVRSSASYTSNNTSLGCALMQSVNW